MKNMKNYPLYIKLIKPRSLKMTKRQRLKEIEQEIQWYNIRKPIADAMRILVNNNGFEFSGHGCGYGGEDFNLINEKANLYVNFCDKGKSCKVIVNTTDDLQEKLFEGTIGKALKFFN